MHACIYILMTKVISLSDDAYADLVSLKSKDESFSEIVRKMAQELKRKKLLSLAGAWKDAPEMDGIFKKILNERKIHRERKVEL